MQARMLWYDITFSLDKAVSPSPQGLTALALFSAGKIHSADRPATANLVLLTTTEKFRTIRRNLCHQNLSMDRLS
jgi:hypothetical protein